MMQVEMQRRQSILIGGEPALDEQKPLMDDTDKTAWDKKYASEPRKDKPRKTSGFLKFFLKLFKLVSYFVFGGMVFGSALISKSSLMILVNSAKPFDSKSSIAGSQNIIPIDNDIMRAWSYIILLIILLTPEFLTIAYSLYRIIMKPEKRIDKKSLLWGGVWEMLHAIGEAILVLKVLPYLDATIALMAMPLIAIIPTCVHVFTLALNNENKSNSNETPIQTLPMASTIEKQKKSKLYKQLKLVFGIFALVLQLGGFSTFFLCFTSYDFFQFFKTDATYVWAIIGIVFTSARYWENFVSDDFTFKYFTIKAKKLQTNFDAERFTSSLIYSFLKCIILVGMTFFIFVVFECDTYTSNYVNGGTNPFTPGRYNKIVGLLYHKGVQDSTIDQVLQVLWYICALQICGSFGAFYFGRVACMTMIQVQSFTLSLVVVTPVVSACSGALAVYKLTGGLNGLLGFLGLAKQYKQIKIFSYYVDWNNLLFDSHTTVEGAHIQQSAAESAIAITIIVGLCLGWLSIVLISLYVWKNPTHRLEKMEVLFVKPLYGGPMIDQMLLLNRRQNPRHYFNVKRNQVKRNEVKRSHHMKRSTKPEVFLCATMWHETEKEMTQILTSFMRLDQHRPSNLTKKEFKSLYDEVYYKFQIHMFFDDAMTKVDGKKTINKYVQQLLRLIPVAVGKVNQNSNQKEFKCKYKYITPYGGRIKYILPCGNILVIHLKDKDKIRHKKRWSQCMYMYYILAYMQEVKRKDSKNPLKPEDVFLLALDGDVDFQPDAISYLMDRMNKNPQVGAACGRIHPIGSGPVVWFQKFEYAVGHWLQKTAEHVLGCVLCSPGSFSLFRGEALGEVMNEYTKRSTEAKHYVQWDQGEDRWLCTLLLKRGSRIEYSAASDSYTFAPETFKEFYNQRRRWGPSTMANVFDILMDARHAVSQNTSLSWGYITYQMGLMTSSLLGPATVIMVIQGAYQYVFKWNSTVSLIAAITPVIIFIILSFTTSADTQIAAAGVLTFIYATVMMAVIVGVVGSLASNAIVDPNNLFMILLVGLYLFTGIVHPQEMMCLIHGFLYYLCVPSAFILLMIYSLANMNDVSWGTRDSSDQSVKEDTTSQNHKEYQFHLGSKTADNLPPSLDGSYSSSLGTLCHCALCVKPKRTVAMVDEETQTNLPLLTQPTAIIDTNSEDFYDNEEEQMEEVSWIEQLQDLEGKTKKLNEKEAEFWDYMINKYLKPLEEDKQKRQQTKKDLAELRNQVIGAFFLLNALWLILNFALQLTITDVAITFWLAGSKVSVNPVSFAFLLFFIVILIIQFFCMLKHRWSTALHFLAKQSLFERKRKIETKEDDEPFVKQILYRRRNRIESIWTAQSTTSFENKSYKLDDIEEESDDEIYISRTPHNLQSRKSVLAKTNSKIKLQNVNTEVHFSGASYSDMVDDALSF